MTERPETVTNSGYLKYFGMDDYVRIDAETRDQVDQWLSENGLLEAGVDLIQQQDGQLALSGPTVDEQGHEISDERELKAMMEDTFPWELVENALLEVVNEQRD